MAEVEQALYTKLTGAAGVTALCATRIYPLVLPQQPTLPAITYQRMETEPEYSFAGSMAIPDSTIQVSCWAATYAAAKGLATAVRAAIDSWSDESASPAIMDCRRVSELDDYEPDPLPATWRVVQRWQIRFRE